LLDFNEQDEEEDDQIKIEGDDNYMGRENRLPSITKPQSLDPTITKKPVEMPKKVWKIGDITEQEKKKIELSFRNHLSSLNKLIQERIKNNALAGPKPQPKVVKPPSLLSTDSHLTRSQTFDSNKIKSELSTTSQGQVFNISLS
jgi:hypothetical protein